MGREKKMEKESKKKVLQIRKGEYLLDILLEGGIRTTYNESDAMDISGWDFNQFAYIVNNLKKVGCKHVVAKWIKITEEPNVADVREATAESGKEIGEALKSVAERIESNEV